MKIIYKYELSVQDDQVIEMPEGTEILSLQVQAGRPCLWALVTPYGRSTVKRKIRTHGTGHEITDWANLVFIGTYQAPPLVFHVFENKQ